MSFVQIEAVAPKLIFQLIFENAHIIALWFAANVSTKRFSRAVNFTWIMIMIAFIQHVRLISHTIGLIIKLVRNYVSNYIDFRVKTFSPLFPKKNKTAEGSPWIFAIRMKTLTHMIFCWIIRHIRWKRWVRY